MRFKAFFDSCHFLADVFLETFCINDYVLKLLFHEIAINNCN